MLARFSFFHIDSYYIPCYSITRAIVRHFYPHENYDVFWGGKNEESN